MRDINAYLLLTASSWLVSAVDIPRPRGVGPECMQPFVRLYMEVFTKLTL